MRFVGKNLQTNVWKIQKISSGTPSKATSFKLGEYNLLPSILTFSFPNCKKFNFGKKVVAIGFPYKHCKYLTALPTCQDGFKNCDKAY